ncbi:YeeE/YedE family protein [Marinimicrobium sp. ARAG 43.8]|uniref:YeeE/YedE family protein n=1 Tax=Marinimicrobium sp. ARAG 43.8 TaxID=3418719 RepID=UPI003CF54571
MTEFTPVTGLIGGLFIGIASVLMLWGSGRITGISGIFGGVLTPSKGDFGWRAAFIAGLLVGALVWRLASGDPLPVDLQVSWPVMIVAGLLVGFGSRLGSGCTSGHGVCGLARLSPRSMVAVVTFMLSAAITTFVVRHVIGG